MLKGIRENHLKLDYNWLKQDYVFDDQDLLTAHQDRGKLLELVEEAKELLFALSHPVPSRDQFDRAKAFLKKLESEAGESTKDTQEIHNCEEIKKVMREKGEG